MIYRLLYRSFKKHRLVVFYILDTWLELLPNSDSVEKSAFVLKKTTSFLAKFIRYITMVWPFHVFPIKRSRNRSQFNKIFKQKDPTTPQSEEEKRGRTIKAWCLASKLKIVYQIQRLTRPDLILPSKERVPAKPKWVGKCWFLNLDLIFAVFLLWVGVSRAPRSVL